MRRILLLLGCALLFVPAMKAQELDHVQLGVFADYFRSNPTDTNMFGVGARAGFSVVRHVKLEAQMGYDFSQVFTEGFTNTGGGNINFQNTGVRVLHGSFGPKFELGHSAFHPFLFAKGGFVNYMFDSRNASFDTFTSSVQHLRTDNVNPEFLAGGGVEGHIGPVGLRLDAGDEMVFNHGAHHNLAVTFGPYIRF
jgi:hypothetical protein